MINVNRSPILSLYKSHSNTYLLIFLTIVFMLPALINAYPLINEDTISYDGDGVGWMRTKIPSLILALPHDLIGQWALPLANSILNALAWVVVFSWIGRPKNYLGFAILLAISLQPLHTSAGMVDSWFFPSVIFFIEALRTRSIPLTLVASVLFSSHGTGLILIPVIGISYAIYMRFHAAVFYTIGAATLVFTMNFVADRYFFPDQPRLSQLFIASKIFSTNPALLDRRWQETGDPMVEFAAEYMKTPEAKEDMAKGRKDLFWDIWNSDRDRFDFHEFENNHAKALILIAITEEPMVHIRATIGDFLSYFSVPATLDFRANMYTRLPEHFYNTLQGRGFFVSSGFLTIIGFLPLLLLAAAVLAFTLNRKTIDPELRKVLFILATTALANDILFASLSGPPDRYHHRILPLLSVIVLIALSQKRTEKIGP